MLISLGMSSKRNKKVKTYNPKTRSKNKKLTVVAAVTVIAIVAIAIVAAISLSKGNSPSKNTSFVYPTVTPLTSPSGEYSTNGTQVIFITSMGNIVIQMRDDKPITTNNFVNLVKEGYYNNTIFQRVIAGFMIQGGEGKTTVPTIQDEIGKDNVNSNMTIAMANTGQPNSASSQFFINVADNNNLYPSFDTSYTVFGKVIYGQNTVMKISQAPVQFSSTYNEDSQPVNPVKLIGAAIMP